MRQTTLNPPDFRRITLKCKKRWKKPHVQFDAYQRELQRVSPSNTGTTQLDGRHTDADVADDDEHGDHLSLDDESTGFCYAWRRSEFWWELWIG